MIVYVVASIISEDGMVYPDVELVTESKELALLCGRKLFSHPNVMSITVTPLRVSNTWLNVED